MRHFCIRHCLLCSSNKSTDWSVACGQSLQSLHAIPIRAPALVKESEKICKFDHIAANIGKSLHVGQSEKAMPNITVCVPKHTSFCIFRTNFWWKYIFTYLCSICALIKSQNLVTERMPRFLNLVLTPRNPKCNQVWIANSWPHIHRIGLWIIMKQLNIKFTYSTLCSYSW